MFTCHYFCVIGKMRYVRIKYGYAITPELKRMAVYFKLDDLLTLKVTKSLTDFGVVEYLKNVKK